MVFINSVISENLSGNCWQLLLFPLMDWECVEWQGL